MNLRRYLLQRYFGLVLGGLSLVVVGAIFYCIFESRRHVEARDSAGMGDRDPGVAAAMAPESSPNGSVDPHSLKPVVSPPREMELPPEGVAWKEVYDALISDARSGNAAAAARLLKDTQRCKNSLERGAQAAAELNAPKSADVAPNQSAEKLEMLDSIQRELDQSRAVCAGVSAEDVASKEQEILLLAAKTGDETASACYVRADFSGGQLSEEAMEQYKANSAQLAERELKRGNWQMVSVLATAAYGSGRRRGISQIVSERNLAKAYAYVRLQRLGAVGDLASEKDRQLATIVASGEVPEKAVQAADQWASETFTQFFHRPLEAETGVDCYGGVH